MEIVALLRSLRGSFLFLHPSRIEIQRVLEEMQIKLPPPQPVFLEGEKASPLHGFLLVETPELCRLEESLERAWTTSRDRLAAQRRGERLRDDAVEVAWRTYLRLLERAAENVTASDYGRRYPTIFWLHHSTLVARTLVRGMAQTGEDRSPLGERGAAEIAFAVYEEWARRADQALRSLERRLADSDTDDDEELYPRIFARMRENVLVFSHEAVDRDLESLERFFGGYLRVDGRDFRLGWRRLRLWHRNVVEEEPRLRDQARFLYRLLGGSDPELLLTTPGYVSHLAATVSGYDPDLLWSGRQVDIWEDLLDRLKTFELLNNLRRLILRVRRVEGGLVCPAEEAGRLGMGPHDLQLSPTLRPLDFLSPWVVDPGVSRGGLVYDIIDFTRSVSQLRDAPPDRQETAFRSFFRLQKKLDRIANRHRLYQEKYLGDGTVYTGRDSRRLVVAAILMQRAYREALARGFPFREGMRIALNHGEYRLLPLGGADDRGTRYEIFGESVVELFRLVSGKSSQQLEEMASTLIARGYAEPDVRSFFAPLLESGPVPESPRRAFEVRLEAGGQLLNKGIVATGGFVRDLEKTARFDSLRRCESGGQSFVVVGVEHAGESVDIGLRPLGRADLKGLGRPFVYEVVDGDLLAESVLDTLQPETLDEAFASLEPPVVAETDS